ncbi:MAG: hypothetical protein HOP17_07235 [Acidobacteria bacterium]|nr:hypothetical protein [Acidobacteriota bacterium]
MTTVAFSFVILLLTTFVPAQNLEKISLKTGQQKTAKTGRVSVKFLAVTEDSRCPENARCIWAGVARVKIQVSKNGKTAEFELNTNQPDKSAVFEGQEIKLTALTPYPKTSTPITPAGYIAAFAIAKSGK